MSFKQKVCENNSPSEPKMLCLQLIVIAVCSASTLTSSLTVTADRCKNGHTLKRDRVLLLNTTDNLQ